MSQRFASTIAVGDRLNDRYEVTEVLGQGGMGTVYKAMHLLLHRPVAVKALHPHIVLDQNAMSRFQQEVKAMSMLSHPHLISVLDAGTAPGGTPFFVMEFLDGPSLGELLASQGPPPPLRAVRMFIQMADALAYAHERNIIHRDLKPNNVVVLASGRNKDFVKLVDLGIAKLLEPSGNEQGLTMTGEIFGSPLYMSPEQCVGRVVDFRSDVYSLGCMMYEILTGDAPMKGGSALETFNMHVSREAPLLSANTKLQPSLAVELLEPVIAKCMQKQPEDRFDSMSDLSQELEEIERELQVSSSSNSGGAEAKSRSQSVQNLNPGSAPNSARSSEAPYNSARKSDAPYKNDDAPEKINLVQRDIDRGDALAYPARLEDDRGRALGRRSANGAQVGKSKSGAALDGIKSVLLNRYVFAGIATFALVILLFFAGITLVHKESAPPVVSQPSVPMTSVSPVVVSSPTTYQTPNPIFPHYNVTLGPSTGPTKVIAVCVYAGVGQENNDIAHFPGTVEVEVQDPGKPVTLVLSSYMATNWKVKRGGMSVKIDRIMASSYLAPLNVEAPAGVPVEKAWYASIDGAEQKRRKFSDNPFDIFPMILVSFNPDTDSNLKKMQEVVTKHIGRPVSSLQGCYQEGKFVVQ